MLNVKNKIINLAREKIDNLPQIVVGSILVFLLFTFLLIIAIDILNLFGLRDIIEDRFFVPYFWYIWFPTLQVPEVLQWFVLGASIFLYISCFGFLYERGERYKSPFFLLVGIGLILMLMEDAGNVRHRLRYNIHYLTGGGIEGNYGVFVTIMEVFYFGAIAFLLVFALLKYRNAYWKNVQARKYLILGYVFYGLAVSSSWLGHAFRGVSGDYDGLYVKIGTYLTQNIFATNHTSQEVYEKAIERMQYVADHNLPFVFMDNVYEESVELLGATFLLGAGVALFMGIKNHIYEDTPKNHK